MGKLVGGGTCHNGKLGHGCGEVGRGGALKRNKWGDTSRAGPATMTSRAMERAMGEGKVWDEVISCLSLWLVGQRRQMEGWRPVLLCV